MGWERNASVMQTSRTARDILIFKKGTQRIHVCFEINSMFWTSVRFFSLTYHVLKTWCRLLRVKLYRNYLKGKKITSS